MTDPQPCSTIDRRPLALRKLAIFEAMANGLARTGISPNVISLLGLLCSILAGAALFLSGPLDGLPRRGMLLAAAIFIMLRGLANILDGMVALAAKKASPVGLLFNEVPDRASDAMTLVGAGYAVGGDPVFGYVAAIVALFVAYVRVQAKVAGAAQDYRGPMAKTHRMFVVTGISLYLCLSPIAWQPVFWPDRGWGLMTAGLIVIIGGGLLTVARRLRSAAAVLGDAAP